MSLERIFSERNVLDYSTACLELGVKMPEVRDSFDFDTLVVPSRGAVPFFLGACYSLNKLKKFGGEHEEFYEGLGVQKILSSLLPESLKVSSNINASKTKVIIVPFTADLNIGKFDPKENNDEYVKKTRNYWANVTASFFKENGERERDPYFRSFADFILKDLEKREDVALEYKNFPKIRRFSMIDTVISGRASNDILQAFDGLAQKLGNDNLMPYGFLIVDEDGGKLRPYYNQYLMRKRLQGQLDIRKIPRIFSEDEGASLLGVASVVYPSVMRGSKMLRKGGEEFFVGAGSWHPGYKISEKHSDSFGKFMRMIYNGVDYVFAREYEVDESKAERIRERFLDSKAEFLDHRARNIKAFCLGESVGLDIFPIRTERYSPKGVYETKSHVVHTPFDELSEKKAIQRLREITGASQVNN